MSARDPVRFAVIITSYNYKRYVVEAVESALNQTRPPHLVVVVDDASTDGSADLLRARYGDDPRVIVDAARDNAGQFASFVRGFSHCAGVDVVTFLDSDDYWRPTHLEQLGALYDARADVDFVFTDLVPPDDATPAQAQGAVAASGQRQSTQPQDFGYTALMTYRTMQYYGTWTSGLSLRYALAAQVHDMPPEIVAMWRTYADIPVVIASSIFGGRKYYLPTGTVTCRTHGENAHLQGEAAVRSYKVELSKRATTNHCARRIGLEPNCMRLLAAEFATKPTPSAAETRRYRRAIEQEMGRLKAWRKKCGAFFSRGKVAANSAA